MALASRSLLLAAAVASASAIVTGIDFGNDFMKVSLVKPGQSFQIATNVASKRKTPVMMAYYRAPDGSTERLYGSDAESIAARKPHLVVTNPQRLLGRNASHPATQAYATKSYYGSQLGNNGRGGVDWLFPLSEAGANIPPYEVVEEGGAAGEGEGDGSASTSLFSKIGSMFSSASASVSASPAPDAAGAAAYPPAGTAQFSAEELSAQLLEYARGFTEVFAAEGLPPGSAKINVKDAVITVPAYYTQWERIALLDAAELAGYKVLQLIDENTAAGIHYGIDRVTPPNETHYMVLYNMGAEATQVTLFAYDSYNVSEKAGLLSSAAAGGKTKTVGQGRVVAKAWDTGLGGRAFDAALIELAVSTFNADTKKYASKLPASAKGDVRNVPLAMAKLRKNVVKAKEVLSANEEFALTVESILPDVDFRMQLSRTILNDAAEKAGLWARVTAVLDACIAQTNGSVPLTAVHVVEVVGGAVRMPKVQALLKDYLAKFAPATPAATPAKGADAAAAPVIVGPSLGVHLNGDEAMALGAAFAAANRSAAFRVRKVGMIDGFPWAIGVRVAHANPTAASAATAAGEESAEAGAEGGEAAGAAAPSAAGKAAAGGAKPWSKRSSLFRPYNHLDSLKRISFSASTDLRASLFYEANPAPAASGAAALSPALPEGTARTLGVYNISGIDAITAGTGPAAVGAGKRSAELGVPKIHLSFELDHNGIARLVRAEATQEEEVVVPILETPTPSPSPSVAANSTDGNSTDTAEEGAAANATATASVDAEGASPTPSADADATGAPSATASPEAGAEGAAADASASPSAAPKTRIVKKTHRYPLTVTFDLEASAVPVRPLTAAEKLASLGRMRKMKEADEKKRQLETAKNSLEGYIYAVREKVEAAESEAVPGAASAAGDVPSGGLWGAVTTEEQREAVTAALRAEEDWLLEDGVADLAGYTARLKALKGLIEPAFERMREARDRADTVEKAKEALEAGYQIIKGWAKTHPQINANETADALDAVVAFDEWLNTTLAKQEESALTEAPVLRAEDVNRKIKSITDLLMRLSRKPKRTPTPAPSVSPAPGDGEKGDEKGEGSGEGEGEKGETKAKDKSSSSSSKSSGSKATSTPKASGSKSSSGSKGSSSGSSKSSGGKASAKPKAGSSSSGSKAGGQSKAKPASKESATAEPTAAAEPVEPAVGGSSEDYTGEDFAASASTADDASPATGATAEEGAEGGVASTGTEEGEGAAAAASKAEL